MSPKIAYHKKIGSENRKSAKCHIGGKPQNEKYLILQIFEFAEVTTADRPLLWITIFAYCPSCYLFNVQGSQQIFASLRLH